MYGREQIWNQSELYMLSKLVPLMIWYVYCANTCTCACWADAFTRKYLHMRISCADTFVRLLHKSCMQACCAHTCTCALRRYMHVCISCADVLLLRKSCTCACCTNACTYTCTCCANVRVCHYANVGGAGEDVRYTHNRLLNRRGIFRKRRFHET